MAQVKYSRIDNRRPSSNYCSSVTIAVFVAVCLLAVWFLTSSSVDPVENIDLSSKNGKDGVKEISTSKPIQISDNQGNAEDESAKGENDQTAQTENKSDEQEKPKEEPQESKPDEKEIPKEEAQKSKPDQQEIPKEEGQEINVDQQEIPKEEGQESNLDQQENPNEESQEGKLEDEINDVANEENSGNEKQPEQGEVTAEKKQENKEEKSAGELLPAGAQSELLNETSVTNNSWASQATESKNEMKEPQNSSEPTVYKWKLCNTTAWADYIPCLDNLGALKHLRSTKHYEHRERHCPESAPTCLVPLPGGYKRPIQWPQSRDKIWYTNVPHTKLAQIKGHQNWVKVTGEFLTFPGGGTQFKHGALHYIEFIEQTWGEIAWGKRTRVVLDVGCGVASLGGYLFDKDVLTMSFAPKDEHEAQVQFALERGIPAISAVMGTKRLPFPGIVFDVVHCARCRVPWHIEGGKLLLELNRVLRPGGFFVWSATPVYQKLPEDVGIWKAMNEITKAMCWELVDVKKDKVNAIGAAIYRKPDSNECYTSRSKPDPPLCPDSDDPNASWGVPLKTCMHRIPTGESDRGSKWPAEWPGRLTSAPYWLTSSQVGVYGKPAPEDFNSDYAHWKRVVQNSYLKGIGVDWSTVRNAMDMRAIYGGFAAAMREMNVWVMNVVSVDSPDTLPIIYERGLFGIYHNWCESFSTYPRSYDLLHADHLFSRIEKKCNTVGLMAEVDRILRPEGKLIVRDNVETVGEVERMVRSMKWEVRLTYSKEKEGLLCVQKTTWRPEEIETIVSSIA